MPSGAIFLDLFYRFKCSYPAFPGWTWSLRRVPRRTRHPAPVSIERPAGARDKGHGLLDPQLASSRALLLPDEPPTPPLVGNSFHFVTSCRRDCEESRWRALPVVLPELSAAQPCGNTLLCCHFFNSQNKKLLRQGELPTWKRSFQVKQHCITKEYYSSLSRTFLAVNKPKR